MYIDLGLSFFTGLCTVFAYLSTRAASAERAIVVAVREKLLKQAAAHDLILEELEALKKRQHKLAGRYFRDLRGSALEPDDKRDPHTVDHVNGGTDAEFEALLALQNASAPKRHHLIERE